MIKKIICFIVKHNYKVSKCPVTGAVQRQCLRCAPVNHHREMTFN
jgi:hypothetical protein